MIPMTRPEGVASQERELPANRITPRMISTQPIACAGQADMDKAGVADQMFALSSVAIP